MFAGAATLDQTFSLSGVLCDTAGPFLSQCSILMKVLGGKFLLFPFPKIGLDRGSLVIGPLLKSFVSGYPTALPFAFEAHSTISPPQFCPV